MATGISDVCETCQSYSHVPARSGRNDWGHLFFFEILNELLWSGSPPRRPPANRQRSEPAPSDDIFCLNWIFASLLLTRQGTPIRNELTGWRFARAVSVKLVVPHFLLNVCWLRGPLTDAQRPPQAKSVMTDAEVIRLTLRFRRSRSLGGVPNLPNNIVISFLILIMNFNICPGCILALLSYLVPSAILVSNTSNVKLNDK